MDSSPRALQTIGKLFSNFGIIFELSTIFLNNCALGLCMRGGEASVLYFKCSVVQVYQICRLISIYLNEKLFDTYRFCVLIKN